jgi:2-keto-4-pentenoate hydratase
MRTTYILAALAVLGLAAGARAACPTVEEAETRASAWLADEFVPGYQGLTVEDGYCGQAPYVARLEAALGPRIGYKVAFTGKASQERFGISEPARGVLIGDMLFESGARVPADYGRRPHRAAAGRSRRPLYEADLVVTVKDASINDATTALEAAAGLAEVVPFIELPDIVVPEGEPLDVGVIVALNAMARYGVIGPGIPVAASEAFVVAFAEMDVVMTDETGAEIERNKGSALLGNPLNAVLWLADHLNAHGLRLEPGQVISLGSLGKLYPPEAGKTITVRYEGLPGGASEARVTFE